MMFGDVAGLMPFVREGKLRALAIASERRNPLAPEMPTFAEVGMPGFVALTFTGLEAPAATPAAIVDKLNAAVRDSLRDQGTREALGKLGSEISPDSPADFAAFLANEKRKWADVVRGAGISLD
jgi:tripartite-type tricarboxylate transporter receptor subunit TctC